MDINEVYRIVRDCTVGARHEGQPVIENKGGATHIYAMPNETDLVPEVELVDVHFFIVGVDRAKAEANRAALVAQLDTYPIPGRLADGPSYIEVGGVLGDQQTALQLFGLGQALGLWKVMTPKSLGVTGVEADEMAGMGFVMVSGYKPHLTA